MNPASKTPCSFTGCPRPTVARGLCAAHHRQQLRGRPLTQLRGEHGQIGAEPRKQVTTWIAPATHAALGPRPSATARDVLEAWAKKKAGRGT
jgi:hypothetical protein